METSYHSPSTILVLVRFNQDFGRMGHLDGLFVCTKQQLADLMGQEIYFGEVLGKHSEIISTMTTANLTILSEEQDFLRKLVAVLSGEHSIAGFNPLDYEKRD